MRYNKDWVSNPGGDNNVLFSVTSRPIVESKYPPMEWVPESLSQGIKRLEREAYYSHPSSAEVQICRTSDPLRVMSSLRSD
jgi:hypothetical protein